MHQQGRSLPPWAEALRRPRFAMVSLVPMLALVLRTAEFVFYHLLLSLVDRVIKAWEEDAFPLARRLAAEEGLFLGMSSGAIVSSALQIARELGPGHRVACIAPDSGARYLTTELYAQGDEAEPARLPARGHQPTLSGDARTPTGTDLSASTLSEIDR